MIQRHPALSSARHVPLLVWSHHQNKGYVFVAALRRPTGEWKEHVIDLRFSAQLLDIFLEAHPSAKWDLYFCPNRFRRPKRRKEFAFPTLLAWSDVDSGDSERCRPRPNIVWKTSPARTQAIWIWNCELPPDAAEALSKSLTIAADGDRGGHSITKYLRIPGTYNHKPTYKAPRVRLLHADWRPQRPPTLRDRTQLYKRAVPITARPITANDHKRVLKKYREKLHPKNRALLHDKKTWEPDRSKCVYFMVSDLHRAGANFSEIAALMAANVYFVSKYGNTESALRREIIRILEKLEANT